MKWIERSMHTPCIHGYYLPTRGIHNIERISIVYTHKSTQVQYVVLIPIPFLQPMIWSITVPHSG